jgi:hypothetical protein
MTPASAIDTSRDVTRVVHLLDGGALVNNVFGTALRRGALVWVGTDTGLRWLEARLNALAVDIAVRRVLRLDATRVLTDITVDGVIDVVRFAEVVGMQIDRVAGQYSEVAIFVEATPNGASATAKAFEALLKSFASSRAVFTYRAFRTDACRSEPTPRPGRNRWSVGNGARSLAIQIPVSFNANATANATANAKDCT